MTERGATEVGSVARAQNRPIRVVLADDHNIVRESLASLLETEPDIEVVGQAHDGSEAVTITKALAPDVVLMDVSMPRMSGLEATRELRRQAPGTRVIGLSALAEETIAEAMRECGAAAYLNKTAPPATLIAAVRVCGILR